MPDIRNSILQSYMSNLQVEVTLASYTHCWRDWKDLDYIPDYNKFYFIMEGEGWLKIKDREYYPRPGELYLMPAGVPQSYSSISDNTFKKYWCHFTAKAGNINIFDILKLPHFIDVQEEERLKGLFSGLVEHYNCSSELASAFRVKALLMEIIAFYIENAGSRELYLPDMEDSDKLQSIISHIDRHLSESISIEQLARIAHFNQKYFIRYFKRNMGCTPMQYIHRVRMEKAKSMLGAAGVTVSEVAQATGFGELFHFSKSFKAHTGFTPTEFKKISLKK